jgi:hypothetical protein
MIIREASPSEVRVFFAAKRMTVLTLLGYSGAEYQDSAVMLEQIRRLLDQFDSSSTIVNIGATLVGIGVAYEIAKHEGFTTSGIVSIRAKESGAVLSPWVDIVFYVKDKTWAGLVEGTKQLAPTSVAMVEASDRLFAIGGGRIARDEFFAAMSLGKPTHFTPADLNHMRAKEMASKTGFPYPTDFRGALGAALSKL